MKFGSIGMLHLLWGLAGLLLLIWYAARRKNRALESFAERELLKDITPELDPGRRRWKTTIVITAIFFMILSLARPQWGFEWKEVSRSGLDILIAIDTSKSMLARDVKPNRLERSKLAVKDLVKKLGGDRVGLIAFAGSAFLQCPLTVDYSGFLMSLDSLDVDTIPIGGTSIAAAIRTAIEGYEGGARKYRVLILITDGEDHSGDALKAAEEAKEKGVKIYAIGIGTKAGELIPVMDEKGNTYYLKDRNGKIVKTRLDEETLKQIALTTGGSYVKASPTEFGLDMIYDQKLSKMEKREIKNRMTKQYHERFRIPLLIALILLCAEPFIRERRHPA
jgi:Ca-activated chloride channel family protein